MRAPGIPVFLLLLFLSAPACAAALTHICVFGDSLSAGYGLSAAQSFPARLEAALQERGYPVAVDNAGVSGDTSAGGLARLDWSLAARPALLIVELGANDALRGLDPQLTRSNLDAILRRTKAAGVQPLLTGMRAPRNLGFEYYSKFDLLYVELARQHQIPFYPFFLEGVATRPELNQRDGLHPNAAGVTVIVTGILPLVEQTLRQLGVEAQR